MNTKNRIKPYTLTPIPYTLILVLALVFLHGQANADPLVLTLTSGDYNIPGFENPPGWSSIAELNTYNNVTITIPKEGGGGAPDTYNMYDNSELFKYGYYINHQLNLYDNATASLFGGNIYKLYVDSESTGWVKLYAYDVTFAPPIGSDDAGHIRGWWLAENNHFDISLIGDSTYSHIQIVPEPATLLFLCLGGLALFRKRR